MSEALARASAAQRADVEVTTWPHQLDQRPTLRVGDVLVALNQEFASLSPSKLRFLDAQGLVSPARTAAGYRLYSGAHVERLRYVLRQQRDGYVPLQVIKENLAQLDAGLAHAPLSLAAAAPDDLSVDDLAKVSGTDAATIRSLIEEGLLSEVSPGLLTRHDVPLASACVAFLTAGADLRELRVLGRAALREVDAARAASAPLGRQDDQAAARAREQNRLDAAAAVFQALIHATIQRR